MGKLNCLPYPLVGKETTIVPIRTLPGTKDDLSSVDLTTLLAAKGGSASKKSTDTVPEKLVFITEGLPPVPNKVVKGSKKEILSILSTFSPRNQALKSCPILTWQKKESWC